MTTFTGPETGGCRLEQTRASTLLSSYKYSCSPRVHWYTHKNLAQRQNYTSAHTTNVICRVCVCLYVCVQQVVRGYRSLKGSRGDGWKARGTSKRDWPCKPSSNKVDFSLLAALTLFGCPIRCLRLRFPLSLSLYLKLVQEHQEHQETMKRESIWKKKAYLFYTSCTRCQ